MTASTISENKDLGKMDWDKMTSVIRSTINLDEEGMLNYRLALQEIMAYFAILSVWLTETDSIVQIDHSFLEIRQVPRN